ncbi:hypothetical protein [Senegalia massiliensis]|uniref:hypothetical protein n=1 Tax=Senegalia massiliensis TaxID=1720316 RepID=UPI001031BB01|nr:hypothetical protein [Senegalia massiliensis]
MKKSIKTLLIFILTIFLSFTLMGCSYLSEKKGEVYNDNHEIASGEDSALFIKSVENNMGNNKSLRFSSFSGVKTLWKIESQGNGKVILDYDIEVTEGDFKIVLVTPDKEIVEIYEKDIVDNKELKLESGKSQIKMVGNKAKAKIKININYEGDAKTKKF